MLAERSWNLALSLTLIVYAYMAWLSVGYYDLSALVMSWILIIISSLLAINSATRFNPRIRTALIYSALFVSMLLLISISLRYVASYYLEDEILIQTNAAYLFLHGEDPYLKINMLKLFSTSQVPLFNTPTLDGGYVYFLIYPGLSVLLFVPALLFHFNPSYVIIIFNFISIILLVYYYRKNNLKLQTPLIITYIMVSAFYIGFTIAGVSSIIWVTLLALAYVFREKPYISGIFLGLSVAYKQDPVIVVPFFLYFILKEYGGIHEAKFILASAASFLAVNLPFIIMNPGAWLISILSVANQNIIGVGSGPSILAFAGYYPIDPLYFSVLVMAMEIFLFFVYVRYYNALKYAFFAFPILVMLFNFRVLISYLMYWPFLIMLILPDIKISENMIRPLHINRAHFLAFSIVLIIITGGFAIPIHSQNGDIKIASINAYYDNISIPNVIDEMNISMVYEPGNGYPTTIPIYFRILTDSGLQNYNINGLLWHTNLYLHPGTNNLTIYPDNYFGLLPSNTSFVIIAYYGHMQTAYRSNGLYAVPKYPIPNPMLMYPEYSSSEPFPGWHATKGEGKLVYLASGFTFNSTEWFNLTSEQFQVSSDLENLTLQYNISGYGIYGYTISFGNFNYTVSSEYFSFNSNYTHLIVNNRMHAISFSNATRFAMEYKWPMQSAELSFFIGPDSGVTVKYEGAEYE
ncbi:glycosyltransferase family 87 protein [Thermoplasma sp.]|uniref:glycosyltransferase family 87 protein n=1 Tax=Thermoplasma sp. TaxID=1973142 RepID=UPI00260FBAC4|nr:glycosyltransferase family 87 protein [Thermoplasma sp.]